jgi:hypothetical protein
MKHIKFIKDEQLLEQVSGGATASATATRWSFKPFLSRLCFAVKRQLFPAEVAKK